MNQFSVRQQLMAVHQNLRALQRAHAVTPTGPEQVQNLTSQVGLIFDQIIALTNAVQAAVIALGFPVKEGDPSAFVRPPVLPSIDAGWTTPAQMSPAMRAYAVAAIDFVYDEEGAALPTGETLGFEDYKQLRVLLGATDTPDDRRVDPAGAERDDLAPEAAADLPDLLEPDRKYLGPDMTGRQLNFVGAMLDYAGFSDRPWMHPVTGEEQPALDETEWAEVRNLFPREAEGWPATPIQAAGRKIAEAVDLGQMQKFEVSGFPALDVVVYARDEEAAKAGWAAQLELAGKALADMGTDDFVVDYGFFTHPADQPDAQLHVERAEDQS